ncbi:MAG: histidine triad nucleotide-binding protein [Chloroflexi bacterium]|nr:histidine triad nucleotide-binding protein [Chloroflexota bacterium]|tara:strand:- start:1572 stop:1946 length:375 start_codon:yes stop_codon:yes gene_type:complete
MTNSYVKLCVFCNIALEKIPSEKIFSDEIVFAFKDINPVAKTHLLIIPKKHYSKISEIKDNQTYLLGHIIKIASKLAIKNKISKTGYRLIFNQGKDAGQEVDHLHCHLIGGSKLSSLNQNNNLE